MLRFRHSTPRLVSVATLALVLALPLTLAGCTAEAPRPTPSRTAKPTPTVAPTAAPAGDGILRIGTLFPMTGAAAAIGAAQVAGTEAAAREMIEQGGVLGLPLELVHRNSAGDVPAGLADLLARGVDVVLWDATTPPPLDAEASAAEAGAVLIPLSGFVTDGALHTADASFVARLRTADPGVIDPAGGAEAYDGVVLAALAATVARNDGGAAIKSQLEAVATGPTPCTSWGECLAALADEQQIGYVGVTGGGL